MICLHSQDHIISQPLTGVGNAKLEGLRDQFPLFLTGIELAYFELLQDQLATCR
ncbi:predicted protein [Sclerotinia sclerotiorum 1980 UF-70]|uniref:Uncharacterized protein n=1 Tax=Sclerotinia sclerotiorum (strain ATCC 18683 / 1980 / Ss-1) TaxID=665079 RepID=A7EZ83_SCLS1|nr:predicted protein [Sclerotinia sclerotiorum 1980 UF-70]EDN94775.1 predicted protein [Sclerotinia sclerotiorum 1980 UF-70]